MAKYLKYVWILMGLAGIWFLASAATENGLLPKGHGFGRIPEILFGVGLIAYSIFRLKMG